MIKFEKKTLISWWPENFYFYHIFLIKYLSTYYYLLVLEVPVLDTLIPESDLQQLPESDLQQLPKSNQRHIPKNNSVQKLVVNEIRGLFKE